MKITVEMTVEEFNEYQYIKNDFVSAKEQLKKSLDKRYEELTVKKHGYAPYSNNHHIKLIFEDLCVAFENEIKLEKKS